MPTIGRVKQGGGAALARLDVDTPSPGEWPGSLGERLRDLKSDFKALSERLIDRSEPNDSELGTGHASVHLMKKLHSVLARDSEPRGFAAIQAAGQPKTIFVRFERDAGGRSVTVRFESCRRQPRSLFPGASTPLNRLGLQPTRRYEF